MGSDPVKTMGSDPVKTMGSDPVKTTAPRPKPVTAPAPPKSMMEQTCPTRVDCCRAVPPPRRWALPASARYGKSSKVTEESRHGRAQRGRTFFGYSGGLDVHDLVLQGLASRSRHLD